MDTQHRLIEEYLPYGLEVARQLHDARKHRAAYDLLLRWDADFPPPVWQGYNLRFYMQPFIDIGALRENAQDYFLPRRRQRQCPFHRKVCQPTREDAVHHALACDWYHQYGDQQWCPTFLVDLLDPWPRDMTPPQQTPARRDALPAALRYYIMQRDQFQCVLCGANPREHAGTTLEIDHKTSQAHGGTEDPDNLQTVCKLCNGGKSLQDL